LYAKHFKILLQALESAVSAFVAAELALPVDVRNIKSKIGEACLFGGQASFAAATKKQLFHRGNNLLFT